MSLFQKTYPCQIKYRLKFLYALYWWEIVNAEMNNGPQRLTSRP
jgi:hypothetical protein